MDEVRAERRLDPRDTLPGLPKCPDVATRQRLIERQAVDGGILGYPALLAFWSVGCAATGAASVGACRPVAGVLAARRLVVTMGDRPVLAGLIAVVVAVGLVALISAPNNYDSMTYHLARVEHWVQNRTVAHYPTYINRQLYLAPGAEYALTHLRILADGDRLANLVQWMAMVGSVAVVSLVARQLGASGAGQLLAAVTCATIPMGILQASSTQNDYVAAFWLLCMVTLAVRPPAGSTSGRYWHAAGLGISLGLALLTKGTAWVYGTPILVWVAGSWLARRRRRACLPLLLVGLIAIGLNLPFLARNLELYGSLLGPVEVVRRYPNTTLTAGVVVSNVVRNTALHLATPSVTVNRDLIEARVRSLHGVLGLDPDDAATSYLGIPFGVSHQVAHEDRAGNPLHLALIAVGLFAVGVMPRLRRDRALVGYGAGLVAAFLLFSLVLKWQPWHSRLQLPLFVVASPFIATVAGRLMGERSLHRLAGILLVAALPWVLLNQTRPVLSANGILTTPRLEQYFQGRILYRDPYLGAIDFIRTLPCTRVGLVLGGDSMEYPLWVGLRGSGVHPYTIGHVAVENAAPDGPSDEAFRPCVILAAPAIWPEQISTRWDTFSRVRSFHGVDAYAPR